MKAKAVTQIDSAPRPMPLPVYYNKPTTIPSGVPSEKTGTSSYQMQVPILGGLFWVSPLNYQLFEQVLQITFAVLVIYYLRHLCKVLK